MIYASDAFCMSDIRSEDVIRCVYHQLVACQGQVLGLLFRYNMPEQCCTVPEPPEVSVQQDGREVDLCHLNQSLSRGPIKSIFKAMSTGLRVFLLACCIQRLASERMDTRYVRQEGREVRLCRLLEALNGCLLPAVRLAFWMHII